LASLTSRLPARLSPLFALLLSARALGAAAAWQVNVNVDLTDAGRKVAHPSPEHPVYYYPVVGGYRELGTAIAGEKPPPALPVVQHLARALARQGYLVSRRVSAAGGDGGILSLVPAPSLILVLHWGCMNPVAIDLTTDSNLPNVAVANESQELALVAGNSLNDLDLNFEKEAVMQGIQQNRYFVTVVAYDFAAYYRKHRKVNEHALGRRGSCLGAPRVDRQRGPAVRARDPAAAMDSAARGARRSGRTPADGLPRCGPAAAGRGASLNPSP